MGKTLYNQSHVTFNYEGLEGTKTNHSNIVSSTMNDRLDFTVEKTSTNDCFSVGENIVYFIHITNTGCDSICSFEVCDNLGGDSQVTYVNGSARIFVDGTMKTITPTGTSPLEFVIDERLNRDEELILMYSVLVGEDFDETEITNEATIKGYECSCCSERCSCPVIKKASLTIPVCQFAQVLISKEVLNDSICCGDELDYFITLTNTGNIDAQNVIVTDSMPEEFTAKEIHMENNGVHYQFDESEYTIDSNNFLTIPNETGTAILVPALKPGIDNITRIRIHGHL